MDSLNTRIAAHYATGGLYDRIAAALTELGVDLNRVTVDDLHPVDEFHTAGIEATDKILGRLKIGPGTAYLDIGSGIGGTARKVAARYGCRAVGVDLTDSYVETAKRLSALAGLDEKTEYRVGSALEMPVAGDAFDVATLLHVGMNIADKAALLREVRRVLKPGGTFAVYDVMRDTDAGDIAYPMPWSSVAETSFVADPVVYRDAAEAAGLMLVSDDSYRDHARDYFARVIAAIEKNGGPPPLGIHLLMGDTAPQKIKNYVECLTAGLIAPRAMIFQAPS